MSDLCIPEAVLGVGGIAGRGGADGQVSLNADGHGAQGYGVPVIHTSTGITADFTVQLTRDRGGTIPASLDNITKIDFVYFSSGLLGRLKITTQCTKMTDGKVSFTLVADQVNYRLGLHYAEFHCYQNTILRHVFKCCLLILKSFVGSSPKDWHPITIAEVRMALYDTSAAMNLLLDDLLFSDIVIAHGIHKAISDWNLMPPELSKNLTAALFPYRSNLCTGACGHVLNMAALRYNRNQMRHANAGLTIDDNLKGMSYKQIADSMLGLWRTWVTTKKNLLNMMLCMGSVSDVYMQSSQLWW